MTTVLSAAVGAQAATQAGWQQLKLQQAKQNAERAEAAAQSLAARAADAQRAADQAQESARNLGVQSDQARSVAGQARQGVAMVRSVENMQAQLSNTVDQAVERQVAAVPEPAAVTEARREPVSPVLNLSGQVTGTVVNTTA